MITPPYSGFPASIRGLILGQVLHAMPHEDKDEPSYPISQSELAEFRQLDEELKNRAAILAGWRHSLISRMDGPEAIEPGPLSPRIVYSDTGLTTQTEEGRVAVVKRHLVVTGTS